RLDLCVAELGPAGRARPCIRACEHLQLAREGVLQIDDDSNARDARAHAGRRILVGMPGELVVLCALVVALAFQPETLAQARAADVAQLSVRDQVEESPRRRERVREVGLVMVADWTDVVDVQREAALAKLAVEGAGEVLV